MWTLLLALLPQDTAGVAVMTGAELPELLGAPPHEIVAFRFEDGWHQIPMQVDERVALSFSQVFDKPDPMYPGAFYADPNTFTGPDTDPTFDADDELCFAMADSGDAAGGGAAASGGDPAGVVAGSRIGLALVDPTDGTERFVYLFRSLGALSPGAGVDRVRYEFQLASGDYRATYITGNGFNPEDSYAETDAYRLHFSDRWLHDELWIRRRGGAETQVLDGARMQFKPKDCTRSEVTHCKGPGAIIANIDGPVRAIRSVIGANSGTLTERRWVLYPDRYEVVTDIRVHSVPGLWDHYDYNAAAVGMTYFDELNLDGLVIDGQPDSARLGDVAWQLVTGQQGSLLHLHRFTIDASVGPVSSHFLDELDPAFAPCTGDAHRYGASGPQLPPLPFTDPLPSENNASGEYHRAQARRTVIIRGESLTPTEAIELRAEALRAIAIRRAP